jgi:hypothetical protein
VNKEDKEKVLHAAVKTTCGTIIKGEHHAECFMKGKELGLSMGRKADDQGFATNKRDFVDRKSGAVIAYNSGQINNETPMLFSEDLWSNVYSGKHDYDIEKGYFLKENTNENR